MRRLLTTVSAIGFAAAIALPVAANAREQTGDGMKTFKLIEVSSVRRHHYRHYRHHAWRYRYYGPRYGYYYNPYNSYAYDPYYYRGPHFYAGPGGVSFGFGF